VPGRPLRICLVTVIAGLALIGPAPRHVIGDEVDAAIPQTRRYLITSVITPVGRDRFSIVPLGATGATITSPMTNVDSNLREVFWEEDAPDVADSGACATWQSASTTSLQQGLALRASSNPGGTRAILVTKNVFLGGTWVFNIDVWDTATSGLAVLKGVNLQDVFMRAGQLTPLPWRMCARARGDIVDFKVWPLDQTEPQWGDPRFGGFTQLPPGWHLPGKTGWYIGHLPAGAFATYRDMETFVL
jgi:hypothetical protein